MSLIRTFEEAKLAYKDETVLALDLETGGFSPWTTPIHVITLCGEKSKEITVLHYPRGVRVDPNVLSWLSTFDTLITHNGTQFDILFLATNGMDWTSVGWYDTLIGEQVSVATGRRDVRVNLQDTVKRRMGKVVDKTIDHAGWGDTVLTQNHLDYCSGDIKYLVDLREAQMAKCLERESLYGCLLFEMDLIPAVVQMSLNGLPINIELLEEYLKMQEVLNAEAEELLIREFGPINFGSAIQLKKVLQARWGALTFPDTTKARFQELMRIGDPEMVEIMAALLRFRGSRQRQNMYSDAWQRSHVIHHNDGIARIHGKFWQVGTDTGRMSSSQPNLQQVTRDMREVFGEYDGLYVGKSDYAQIEVRVSAALAEDQTMIAAINRGEDIHTFVASQAFGIPTEDVSADQRKVAKAMNFLLLFGGGVDGLYTYALASGSSLTRTDIQVAYDRYFERFVGIAGMKQTATRLCDTRNAVVLTYPTGLRRVIAGWELKPTTLLNNSVQGTAAAGLKKAIALCHERDLTKYLCAAVHDELVYVATRDEIQKVRTKIDTAMLDGMRWALEGCPHISIGVESTWGTTWKGDKDNERKTESG